MTARSRANAGRNYAAPLLRFGRLMRVFTGQRSASPVGSVLQLTTADQNRCSCHTGTIWGVPRAADEARWWIECRFAFLVLARSKWCERDCCPPESRTSSSLSFEAGNAGKPFTAVTNILLQFGLNNGESMSKAAGT